jgi:hypothetical protein
VFAKSRQCVNLLNLFYVCGEFTPKLQRKSITHVVKKVYELHFGTRAGQHVHVAVDVRDTYVAGSLALASQYLSQSV